MIHFLKRLTSNKLSEFPLIIFLIIWLFFNLLQAKFTGLHADEAYYWVYSRFLAWGYFDHPPMVALFIKAGYSLFQNTLGLRLVTVLSYTLSIYFIWQMVKPYAANPKVFILLFSSVIIFHVYGVITTPDSPLFFFSVLFLYVYQQYVKEDHWKWGLLLGALAAATLMSKYHGILMIFFILISNLSLLKRPSFWLAIFVALVLYLPHIYWQYSNDYPSLQYHLFDRSASPYKIKDTALYLLDQLLMTGPLTGWFLIAAFIRQKTNHDQFLISLKFMAYGFFVFFFINTFKGSVQAHWTLLEYVALFIPAYIYTANNKLKKVYQNLLIANIVLIIFIRLVVIYAPGKLKEIKYVNYYYGRESWAKNVQQAAKGAYVIFQDGFKFPSYYNFYNQTVKGFGYNSYNYRKTQYDIWPIEDSLRHKKVFFVSNNPFAANSSQTVIPTDKGVFYGTFLEQVRLYQKVNFTPENYLENWQKGETRTISFKIYNPYQETISFADKGEKWKCRLNYVIYKYGKPINVFPVMKDFKNFEIKPQETHLLKINIKAPEQAGKYKLIISVQTTPFHGSRNSRMISLNVN